MSTSRCLAFTLTGLLAACGDNAEPACSDEPGTACTWAGVPQPSGFNEDVRHRLDSWFGAPVDLTFAPDGRAWIVDWNNHRLRRVEADDTVMTVIGNAAEGDGTPDNADLLPIGNPIGAMGPSVSLNHPTDVEFLPDGDAVIAAWHNNKIRVWDAQTGLVKVLAGTDYGYRGDDGPAAEAMFDLPKSATLGPDGKIYVVDTRNQRVRVIAPDGNRVITTIAGDGTAGYSGDQGPATDAQIWLDKTGVYPEGSLVLDADYLYLADSGNNRIRRINRTTNVIDCIAGNGTAGNSGDGGPAIAAALNQPIDMELGPDGRLYFTDSKNFVIRAIDLQTGMIERIAGTGEDCARGTICLEDAEGLPADQVVLNRPYGIAFDAAGDLYIADTWNNRIVRVTRSW